MLTLPEVLTYKGVTVFPDDEDPNLFYALPDRPRLRTEDGDTIFRALFWTDEARPGEDRGVAGLRGGMINFDTVLAIPPEVEGELLDRIRSSGVQEQRREALAHAQEELRRHQARIRDVSVDTIPLNVPPVSAPRLGAIHFTDGAVRLEEEGSGDLVAFASTGGKPSLIGENVAAFKLRLTAEGAAVWYRALEQDAGAIGVSYELSFPMRLPSLEIRIWASNFQSLELERKAERTKDRMKDGCKKADVARIDVKEITSTLIEDSLVNIEVVKGTAEISDEHVAQMRTFAIELMQEKIKEVISNKIHGLTKEERENSLIQTISEEVRSMAELRFKQRDVITWTVPIRGTMVDFLSNVAPSDRDSMLTLIDLSDPVVSTLEVQVSADADWDADPRITAVIVDLHYGRDDDGHQSVRLTKNQPSEAVAWRRKPAHGSVVRYTARAFLAGFAEPVEVTSGQTNGDVQINVPALGRFEARVEPHPNTFAGRGQGKITGIRLDYRYKSPHDPDHVAGSTVMRPEDAVGGVTIVGIPGTLIDEAVEITPTFLRASEPSIEGRTVRVWTGATTKASALPSPWPDQLDVRVNAAQSIPGLDSVRVELQHETSDGGFTSQAAIVLDKMSNWAGQTSLPQIDADERTFRCRYTVLGSGQATSSSWFTLEGDQFGFLLPIMPVTVRPNFLGLGDTAAFATVQLTYTDEPNGLTLHHEVVFDPSSEPAVWLIPRVDPAVVSYTYQVTLFTMEGETVGEPQSAQGQTLFARPPAG
jgi:hypothetical protein